MQISQVRPYNTQNIVFGASSPINKISAKVNGADTRVVSKSEGTNSINGLFSSAIFVLNNYAVVDLFVKSCAIDANRFHSEALKKYPELEEAFDKGSKKAQDGTLLRKVQYGRFGYASVRDYSSNGDEKRRINILNCQPIECFEDPTLGKDFVKWDKSYGYNNAKPYTYKEGYVEHLDGTSSFDKAFYFDGGSCSVVSTGSRNLPNGEKLEYCENIVFSDDKPAKYEKIYFRSSSKQVQERTTVIYENGLPKTFSMSQNGFVREITFENGLPAKYTSKQNSLYGCCAELSLSLPNMPLESAIKELEKEQAKIEDGCKLYGQNSYFDFLL